MTAINAEVSQSSSGGGAVTVGDGADVTQGVTTQSHLEVTDATAATQIQLLKGLIYTLKNGASVQTVAWNVTVTNGSLAVTQSGPWALSASAAVIGAVTQSGTWIATQGGSPWGFDHQRTNGTLTKTTIPGLMDVFAAKKGSSATTQLTPSYGNGQVTNNSTSTLSAGTCYLSALVISCSAAGSAWTCKVQNKEATPKILVPTFTLSVPATGQPIILQFAEPVLMTSGIDVITAGTTPGTLNLFWTYWS